MTLLTTLQLVRSLTVSALAALVLVLGGVTDATATPIPPISCAGTFNTGGCAPYGTIEFATGSVSGSLYEYDESVALDYSAAGTSAAIRGVVDLQLGLLRVLASGIEDGNPSTGVGGYVLVSGTDVFTLSGPSTSGLVTFGVELAADGVGAISNDSYSGQASIQLGVPGGGAGSFDFGVYQAGNNAPLGASFSLLSTIRPGTQLRAYDTHTVAIGTPFALGYSLRADVSQGTTFDLLNTAHLRFVLPDGVTISSIGGFSAGAPAPTAAVPEPATLGLCAFGLLATAWRRSRRKPEWR